MLEKSGKSDARSRVELGLKVRAKGPVVGHRSRRDARLVLHVVGNAVLGLEVALRECDVPLSKEPVRHGLRGELRVLGGDDGNLTGRHANRHERVDRSEASCGRDGEQREGKCKSSARSDQRDRSLSNGCVGADRGAVDGAYVLRRRRVEEHIVAVLGVEVKSSSSDIGGIIFGSPGARGRGFLDLGGSGERVISAERRDGLI